ncbi:2-dehydro-3-deoxyglucarate aldolase [Bordetella genomosp. 10]|uniref:2-dehydro-3-deoxyglucarate aldolase n=1 Tax=Bordetella genomosp. 10 TaxID=1416804 RepID=A0A261SKJ8_9BORD|nr:aldolase/citrate lyase family protein [Bordetella genomosp. 10]OZI37472.1 2-dehydro-3-deoxyglucarate aldolase [Bordetella genomosp. 10]
MTANNDLLVNPFRQRLARPGVPLGTWLMSGATSTAEAMGRAGFDWLLVDLEHVPMDQKDTLHTLQAIAGTSACAIARLPANDAVCVKRALDLGAGTLMFPFIDTPEQAAQAVANAKYPPQGTRGFAAVHRASGYGTATGYGARANDSVFTIIQLETPRAVSNLEAMAAVPGVDAFFLGPGDLSANMGHIGNITHPDVLAVIEDVAKRCQALGKPCGIVGPTPEIVRQFLALGYRFVAVASDMGMMMRQATAFIQAIQPDLARTFDGTVY